MSWESDSSCFQSTIWNVFLTILSTTGSSSSNLGDVLSASEGSAMEDNPKYLREEGTRRGKRGQILFSA